jgi:hypothetical protein
MKQIATRLILAAAVLATAGAGTMNAQVLDRMTFKTDFPFVAGNTTLPAGSYRLAPVVDDNPMVLELTNGRVSVLLETNGESLERPPAKSEVRFNKYGDTYVLHEILDADAQTGAVIVPSRAEKRHQKGSGKPTQHSLATTKTAKP